MPRCRCHSRKQMKRCCGPLLAGKPAPTPEALMRSRFAAYALGKVNYILRTTAPDGPQYNPDTTAWRNQVASFSAAYRFTDLEIVSAPDATESMGTVHFRAHLTRDGEAHVLEEQSLFRRVDTGWLYVGPVPPAE